MTTLQPYVFFDGRCAEAMQFYASVLGGKLDIMTHDQAPPGMPMPPGNEKRVMHARLEAPGLVLMASDWLAEAPFPGASGFRLALTNADTAAAHKLFDALAAGGRIDMPFSETFWAEGFGMLQDRFGTPWMVNGASRMPG